jgi:hypothetical protein
MEELVLTDPVVTQKTTAKYHVISFTMDMVTFNGFVGIILRDNNNEQLNFSYKGVEATTMIKQLNTANLSTKSMHKRILEKLSNDGLLPGTVTGVPDA